MHVHEIIETVEALIKNEAAYTTGEGECIL